MKPLLVTSLLVPVTKYWSRLGLDPSSLDADPTIEKLCHLHERHLSQIPFENLAQHGCTGGPAVLDLETTAHKILERQRGGFCMELNPLFGIFLQNIGYQVRFVLAHVFAGDAYRDDPTHVVLIVDCPTYQSSKGESTLSYFCDVGFGEPALHPLDYQAFGKEQITPEGMRSKLVKTGDMVELQWLKNGTWQPRLKWSFEQSLSGVKISDLSSGLEAVQAPESIFSQKVITTRLTRTQKMTLAGSRFKITGPPRFHDDGSEGPKETRELTSVLGAQEILEEQFAIPTIATNGLSLEKSNQAAKEVWSQF